MQSTSLSPAVLLLALPFFSGADAPAKPRGSPQPPLAAQPAPRARDAKYDLSLTGIEWGRGLESALGKGRPILLFQLLGNFDDAFC